MADVKQLPSIRRSCGLYFGQIRNFHMQAGSDVHARLQSFDDRSHPAFTDNSPPIGHAEDEGFHACDGRFGDGHLRKSQIRIASRQSHLSQAPVVPPMNDAVRCFSGELIRGVAKKHQIWMFDIH